MVGGGLRGGCVDTCLDRQTDRQTDTVRVRRDSLFFVSVSFPSHHSPLQDSLKFLPASLEKLVKNLRSKAQEINCVPCQDRRRSSQLEEEENDNLYCDDCRGKDSVSAVFAYTHQFILETYGAEYVGDLLSKQVYVGDRGVRGKRRRCW